MCSSTSVLCVLRAFTVSLCSFFVWRRQSACNLTVYGYVHKAVRGLLILIPGSSRASVQGYSCIPIIISMVLILLFGWVKFALWGHCCDWDLDSHSYSISMHHLFIVYPSVEFHPYLQQDKLRKYCQSKGTLLEVIVYCALFCPSFIFFCSQK